MGLPEKFLEQVLEPDRILDLREVSDVFPFDVLGVWCHLQKRALVALAMRAVPLSPDGKCRLRDRRERRLIGPRSEPGLDQRCKAEISAVREALAGLSKKSVVLVRATHRIGVPHLRGDRSGPVR